MTFLLHSPFRIVDQNTTFDLRLLCTIFDFYGVDEVRLSCRIESIVYEKIISLCDGIKYDFFVNEFDNNLEEDIIFEDFCDIVAQNIQEVDFILILYGDKSCETTLYEFSSLHFGKQLLYHDSFNGHKLFGPSTSAFLKHNGITNESEKNSTRKDRKKAKRAV
jgi:hypothetical protein